MDTHLTQAVACHFSLVGDLELRQGFGVRTIHGIHVFLFFSEEMRQLVFSGRQKEAEERERPSTRFHVGRAGFPSSLRFP